MQALRWALAVLLVLVGPLMMRRPPRRSLGDRADNERLGVRIEQAIERLRRKG